VAVERILEPLRRDQVVLIRGITADAADRIIADVARGLGLHDRLELQANLADLLGHRQRTSKYYMTVNARDDYQFIPPHSEGSCFTNMQLASFFCHENSTDGGSTVLLNVDQGEHVWAAMKEKAVRGQLGARKLERGELVKLRVRYGVDLPGDALAPDDEILGEIAHDVPGVRLFDVLTRPRPSRSTILDRMVHAYWDSIASIDLDSAPEYLRLLEQAGLLRRPPSGVPLEQLDNASARRLRRSGARYRDLFACKVTVKLGPGDFILQNNTTWAHSTSNWTPGSGTRRVAAAFA
jgi:hypothetical protein